MTDVPLSSLHASPRRANAYLLGRNGAKLLHEQFPAGEQPTGSSRRLEVTLLWGDTVVDVRTFAAGRAVKIGPTPAADFRVYEEGLPETFNLVSDDAVHAPDGASVAVFRDREPIRSPGAAPLALEERAQVTVGMIHFILRWIRPPARGKTGLFDSVDSSFTKVLSVALMIHLGLFVGFWITPVSDDLLSEELFKNPKALVSALIKPPKFKVPEASRVMGAKPKNTEGTIGKPKVKKPDAAPPKKGASIVDAKKREADHQRIISSGLLMGLNGLAGVFGSSSLSNGINDALGALRGGTSTSAVTQK